MLYPMSLIEQMTVLGQRAKAASRELARLDTERRNTALLAMADALDANSARLAAANALDIEAALASGLPAPMVDRLRLTPARIAAMTKGIREVAALPDPVGRVLDERVRPNGLRLRKIATPIGVVVIIFESRPNVTADAASLCFKSGNATILRGGREALNSNRLIAAIMAEAAHDAVPETPTDAIQLVDTTDREAIPALLSLTDYVDLCMPRGGEGLIRAVTACSKVPVIKHYKGVCHVYVHAAANLEMARRIVTNAKTQRPAVCNAMETLLVDGSVAEAFLRLLLPDLLSQKVQIRADTESFAFLQSAAAADPANAADWLRTATEEDYRTEYNDLIMNLKVVPGLAEAIDHINTRGSAHSDSIVTSDETAAARFLAEVDSSAVYWNASTRFTDGGEFGMGAEIGISTDKIGARGPMGLEELTTYKWLGYGTGQVRV